MRRLLLFAGFLLSWAIVPAARGQVVVPDEGGLQQDESGSEVIDRAKEKACACCQECQAATGTSKRKEEGPPRTNACRDCCKRCGRKQPTDKTAPPDIIRQREGR